MARRQRLSPIPLDIILSLSSFSLFHTMAPNQLMRPASMIGRQDGKDGRIGKKFPSKKINLSSM